MKVFYEHNLLAPQLVRAVIKRRDGHPRQQQGNDLMDTASRRYQIEVN